MICKTCDQISNSKILMNCFWVMSPRPQRKGKSILSDSIYDMELFKYCVLNLPLGFWGRDFDKCKNSNTINTLYLTNISLFNPDYLRL